MDFDTLLERLWQLVNGADFSEFQVKLYGCLKGLSSDDLLLSVGDLLATGQYLAARNLLKNQLPSHRAAGIIKRRLQMVLLFQDRKISKPFSLRSRVQGREALLRQVNELIPAGKSRAAAELIEEDLEAGDKPELLDLLGRIYMLERRPQDAAAVMRRALQARRQLAAFIEPITQPTEVYAEFAAEDAIDDADLAFIAEGSSGFDEIFPSEARSASVLFSSDNSQVGEWFAEVDATSALLPGLKSNESLFFHDQQDRDPQRVQSILEKAAEPNIEGQELGSGEFSPAVQVESLLLDEAPSTDFCFVQSSDVPVLESKNAASVNAENITITKGVDAASDRSSGRQETLCLKTVRKLVEVENPSNGVKVIMKRGHCSGTRTFTQLIPVPAEREQSYSVEYVPILTEGSDQTSQDGECWDEDGDTNENVGRQPEFEFSTKDALDLGADPDDEFADPDHGDLELLTIVDEDGVATHEVLQQYNVEDLEDEYAAYAFDPDELYDQLDEAQEENDLLSQKLSRADRATQKAAELIGKFSWPISTLPLIQQIFFMSGWGQTRMALEREMEKGMSPGELILASHLKVIWAENDFYWIAFDKNGSSSLSQYVLSWPSSLLVVRSFDSLPQIEELEHFIGSLFEYWYEKPTLRRAFRSFNRFLWFRMANLQGCLPANEPFSFGSPFELPVEEYSDLGLSDPLEVELTSNLRDFGVFQTKHPLEPSCYVSDQPLAVEEYTVATKRAGSALKDTDSEPPCIDGSDDDSDEQNTDSEIVISNQNTQHLSTQGAEAFTAPFGFEVEKDLVNG